MNPEQPTPKGQLYRSLTENFVGNDEQKLQWQRHCKEALLRANKGSVQEAEESLQKASKKSPLKRRFIKWLPPILVGAAMIFQALITSFSSDSTQIFNPLEALQTRDPPTELNAPNKSTQQDLSEEDLLLVFGNTDPDEIETGSTILHRRHPQNPAYFSEYLLNKRRASDEKFEEAMAMDNTNGWIPLYYAGQLAGEAVVKNPEHNWDKSAPSRKLANASKLAQVLKLTQRAAESQSFERHSNNLQEKRVQLLSQNKSLVDDIQLTVLLANDPNRDATKLLKLGEAIRFHAKTLATNGDTSGFLELLDTSLAFYPRSLSETRSLIGTLSHTSYLKVIATGLTKPAKELELNEQAEELEKISQELSDIKTWYKNINPSKIDVQKSGGLMAALTTSSASGVGVEGVEQPSLEDLAPGRMKYLIQFERIFLFIYGGTLVALALLSLLISLLGKRSSKALASSISGIFPFRDILITLGLSFFIPVVAYLVITRLTPLGCLDWSLGHSRTLPHSAHFSFAAYLNFLLIASISSLFARRRLRLLGLAEPIRHWLFWTPSILLLVALLSAGSIRYIGQPGILFAAVAANLGLLLFLVHLLMRTFGHGRNFLIRIITLRAAATTLAMTSILISALHLPASIRVAHWVSQETFCPQKETAFHLTSSEASFDREFKKRLDAIIASSPLFP